MKTNALRSVGYLSSLLAISLSSIHCSGGSSKSGGDTRGDEFPFASVVTAQPEINVVIDGETWTVDSPREVYLGRNEMGGDPIEKTITIQNNGSAPLLLKDLQVPSEVSLVGLFPSVLGAGQEASFGVELLTANSGTIAGAIRFVSNDIDEAAFTIKYFGSVCSPSQDLTSGIATVFKDGNFTSAPYSYKPTYEICLFNLGQYDANGQMSVPGDGTLSGKYLSTQIISLDERNPTLYGSLGPVSDLNSASNDFRIDYTGASQNNKRVGILQSAQAQSYAWVDLYRTRFLNDSFIESLNLPSNLSNNLKYLQYRPDLQGAINLRKPDFASVENLDPNGLLIGYAGNNIEGFVRTRGSFSGFDSLPPLAAIFDAEASMGDYAGLAAQWIVGFNTPWTFSFSNWQNNILAPLNDAISNFEAHRFTGNSEIYKSGWFSVRSSENIPCDGTNVACDKGYNLKNVMMFDEAVSNADGVFPYHQAGQNPWTGWQFGQGPSDEEIAALFFNGVLYDIEYELGLGTEKTAQLLWKSISLITNGSTYTVRNWGATLQQAARELWPVPGNPSQSIYENSLKELLASRGIPLNGLPDFRTNLPTAVVASSHPSVQPNASSHGLFSAGQTTYTHPTSANYMAYQFFKHSKYGPCDKLEITDGTFTGGNYNNNGTFYISLKDRELSNLVLFVPGNFMRLQSFRGRCANENTATYWEDTRPFGFRILKATPNGFSFAALLNGETATHKNYHLEIVDPSTQTLGEATYSWVISDFKGNVVSGSGTSLDASLLKNEPIQISITRTRNSIVDTLTMTDRSNDLNRSASQAFVRDLATLPLPPSAPRLALTSDSGASNTDGITKFTTLTFQGEAQIGALVKLFVDGTEVGSGTAVDGTYAITTSSLTEGTKSVIAIATFGSSISPNSVSSQVTIDTTAPSLTEKTFEYLTRRAVHFKFSENVGASVTVSNVTLENRSTMEPVSSSILSLIYDSNANDAAVVFSSYLPSAFYRMRIIGTGIEDIAGNSFSGDDYFDVGILNGDSNQDGIVNISDLANLASNWQQLGRNYNTGDFNYDQKVDVSDLSLLATNWQNSITPGPIPISGPPVHPLPPHP